MRRYYFDLISGKKRGLLAVILRAFLSFCSLFYYLGTKIPKRSRYQTRCKTISVGNITAGGSGKTPFVLLLASKLQNVGIVYRPYKASKGSLVPREVRVFDNAEIVGDEALMVKRRLQEVVVFTGKKAQAAKEIEKKGVEVIIVDDGFQHTALHRDCDIVIIDAECPFGYERLLPRGMLREPISALGRATLIVLNKKFSEIDTKKVIERIKDKSTCPIIEMHYEVEGFYTLQGEKKMVETTTPLFLFCGIAKPESFSSLVKSMGYNSKDSLILGDHDQVDIVDLQKRFQESKAEAIVCTEKDAVKLSGFESLPIYWIKIKASVSSHDEKILFKHL